MLVFMVKVFKTNPFAKGFTQKSFLNHSNIFVLLEMLLFKGIILGVTKYIFKFQCYCLGSQSSKQTIFKRFCSKIIFIIIFITKIVLQMFLPKHLIFQKKNT